MFLIHGFGASQFAGSNPRPSTCKIEIWNGVTTGLWTTEYDGAWPGVSALLPVFCTTNNTHIVKVRFTFTGSNYILTKLRWVLTRSNINQAVNRFDTRIQSLKGGLTLPSLQFNSGTTQTASLRGSKTIGTPSTTDTITVVGAAVGDIVSVSRGKDAFVSAANTVQLDSTGLAGVTVSAIVERFV